MLGNRDNDQLCRRDARRQNQSVVVAVYHDDAPDQTGRYAPGGVVWVSLFIITVQVGNVKGLGKMLSEVMGSTGLQSLSVMHQRFHGIGCGSAREFFFFAFLSNDNRNRHNIFCHFTVDV